MEWLEIAGPDSFFFFFFLLPWGIGLGKQLRILGWGALPGAELTLCPPAGFAS